MCATTSYRVVDLVKARRLLGLVHDLSNDAFRHEICFATPLASPCLQTMTIVARTLPF